MLALHYLYLKSFFFYYFIFYKYSLQISIYHKTSHFTELDLSLLIHFFFSFFFASSLVYLQNAVVSYSLKLFCKFINLPQFFTVSVMQVNRFVALCLLKIKANVAWNFYKTACKL